MYSVFFFLFFFGLHISRVYVYGRAATLGPLLTTSRLWSNIAAAVSCLTMKVWWCTQTNEGSKASQAGRLWDWLPGGGLTCETLCKDL